MLVVATTLVIFLDEVNEVVVDYSLSIKLSESLRHFYFFLVISMGVSIEIQLDNLSIIYDMARGKPK